MARLTIPPAATMTAPPAASSEAPAVQPPASSKPSARRIAATTPGTPAKPPTGHPAESPTVRPPVQPPATPAPKAPNLPKPPKVKTAIGSGRSPRPPASRTAAKSGRKPGATRSAKPDRLALPKPTTTTGRAYHGLDSAFRYFNAALFGGRLPECVITLQRHKGSYGYFAGGRFADVQHDNGGKVDKSNLVDEIAMNPTTFQGRPTRDVLSTLVHEMTHVEQHHEGKPSRGGYHNSEWALLMDRVGLTPTDTGKPGGKRTGQAVTHMIVPGGPFDRACAAFLKAGGTVTLYADRWLSDEDKAKAKKKYASKTKYTCPCCELNAWGKPDLRVMCMDCDEELQPEEGK